VLAAKQSTTIDHITGGRFAINLVAGWNADEILKLRRSAMRRYNQRFSPFLPRPVGSNDTARSVRRIGSVIDQLVNGLTLGMLYILVALGLNIILGLMGVINFSHGAFFMLGAYVAYTVIKIGGGYALAVVDAEGDFATWQAAAAIGQLLTTARTARRLLWLEDYAAASRGSPATAVAAALPQGLDSRLGRSFTGGQELSGGQWRRLAPGSPITCPRHWL